MEQPVLTNDVDYEFQNVYAKFLSLTVPHSSSSAGVNNKGKQHKAPIPTNV
ncbi:hypothetical protein SAMN04487943_11534 [Gracilibacillus orientalis]|uniref:Uncharacterized protein n=1 Tax=Gracilibacillus orientalis TaxID=334253 RepID=A0A1I4Q9B3_9BACI|nr:hypothetical protein SAMN04487943_11534 [Gracilibacillus orientalis]